MDILLRDQGDGGEVVLQQPLVEQADGSFVTDNADIFPDTGIGTAVYTALFTDATWSDLLKSSGEQVRKAGEYEQLLNEPITLGTVQRLKTAALAQLSFLKSSGAAKELEVSVSNPAVGRILVDIVATEPNDTENRFKMLWNQQEQKIIEVKRNG